jgi:hypothetical protein
MKWFVLSIVVLAALLTGCRDHNIESKMHMYEDTAAMKQEILKFVPMGTKLDVAQKTMEQEGFRCEFMKNKTYVTDHGRESTPTNFLWCDKRSGGGVVTRRWQVVMEDKDGTISTASVSTGLIGP